MSDVIVVPSENQETITDWQEKTFGRVSVQRAFARFKEEVEELEWCIDSSDHTASSVNECADVLITLYAVVQALGGDLHAAVDEKMKINRERKWRVNGDGTGQHVK
jgi:NTP pyrophosphatase (non-canonical NTP hydrolase)